MGGWEEVVRDEGGMMQPRVMPVLAEKWEGGVVWL